MRIATGFAQVTTQLAAQVSDAESTAGRTALWASAKSMCELGEPLGEAERVLLPAFVMRETDPTLKRTKEAEGRREIAKAYGAPAGVKLRRDFLAETIVAIATDDASDDPDAIYAVGAKTFAEAWIERQATMTPDEKDAKDGPLPTATEGAMLRGSDVVPKTVRWAWKDRIALGKLTILDGRPGIFKSGQAFDIAARITTGAKMPDGTSGVGPANVIIVSGEDDPEDTIVPRLMGASADLSRVYFWTELVLPDGADALEQRVREVDAKLVIVDPLVAFVQGKYNLYHDQQSRLALRPLADIGKRTGTAVLGLRHTKKSQPQSGGGQDAGAGSVAIGGAARSNTRRTMSIGASYDLPGHRPEVEPIRDRLLGGRRGP